MRIYDANIEAELTLADLKRDYPIDDSEYSSFKEYFAAVIDATLRGRNDCSFIDCTEAAARRIMQKIINSLPD